MPKIHINILTPFAFFAFVALGMGRIFVILYTLIFCHEIAHFLILRLLFSQSGTISLLPWGCMLSYDSLTCEKKSFQVLLFLAGPLFNIALFFLGIFPKENLTLALFNLIVVPPLDGGMIMTILFPRAYKKIAFIFSTMLLLLSIYLHRPPILPIFLFILIFCDKKRQLETLITTSVRKFLDEK